MNKKRVWILVIFLVALTLFLAMVFRIVGHTLAFFTSDIGLLILFGAGTVFQVMKMNPKKPG
jgi:uncharacterized membrane protein